jgi:dTDP-4-dehydrorhamnose 3,5-epimerase
MRILPTEIPGVHLVESEAFADERGSFMRVWCGDALARDGLDARLSQASMSWNGKAGTLRGLHFQEAPHEEAKLVRCVRGALFDVALDLREGDTFGRWVGVRLDAESGHALYIAPGCAHGFQTLVDDTEVLYFISAPYVPEASRGVRWDDPRFAIEWPPADALVISDRDRAWPDYGR